MSSLDVSCMFAITSLTWWNSNLRTASWRASTMQNFISVRRCGWSRRIPNFHCRWKDSFRGVSPGSAETLVRTGGMTNRHSIAHCLSNIFAKNYQNRLMCVELIVFNISVVFLKHALSVVYYGRRTTTSSWWNYASDDVFLQSHHVSVVMFYRSTHNKKK